VLHIMERIAQAGAGFRSITENIDTTTPAGRMMMQMIGSFAELERATIRE
jgi:DNA invertase Pin-like site-specific DNA recombinase